MSTFKYGDEKINTRDILIAVPSIVIAVGILPFPRILAEKTVTADGWLAIVISGLLAIMLTWITAKLASNFPHQSFFTYASSLVTRPAAAILTFLFALQGVLLTSFEVSAITDISHQYLFERTPFEIVALIFLLVVVQAVAGSRVGIFRLNSMFLPIILVATAILVFFSIGYVEVENILPLFKTDMHGYMQGTIQSSLSYTGISVLLFYISLVQHPKKAPGRAALGMGGVVILYVIIYLTCIAVFGNDATANIRFPLIELAKTVEIPGGFFERLESIFFVIWIIAIFTTTAMAYDVAVFALNSLFPKINKKSIVFILSPVIYLMAITPQTFTELGAFGNLVSYLSWGLNISVVTLFWVIYKFKGVKNK
ncbi:GerAB/ArcD/ProY family transporter [Oceanobacillus massiliensis]|uniref:GerAB/ArcD/ProY family transporter n=1 Tax=Oceanobacillus massiliensis TaxID=1465765 RepID=UPI000289EB11|nr:endospore germination permease [Oceanobacillus massiliensis]